MCTGELARAEELLDVPFTLPIMETLRKLPLLGFAHLLLAQVVLLDGTSNAGSFESGDECGANYSADGWTVANGTQTHRWAIGTLAGAHHGTRAIFISDQTDCSAYHYDISGEDVVHFWRDITVPAGYSYVVVSFYARLQGDRVQAFLHDYLGVYLAPTTVTPTPATLVNNTYRHVGAALISNEWTFFQTHLCLTNTTGGTYRLIFSWRTTNTNPSYPNSGTQPPAAIDRIHIVATNTLPTVIDVPSLPYKVDLTSTCGSGNNFTSTNTGLYCNTTNIGFNMYRNGEDIVWRFTANATGELRIRIWGVNTFSHWMLYEGGTPPTGCSNGLTGGSCVVEDIWSTSTSPQLMYACVTAGQTYYLIFNQTQSTVTATNCGKFDSLLIEPVPNSPPNLHGAFVVNSLPYSHGPGNTCGHRNRFDHSNSGNCGMTTYHSGNDHIWQFTPTTSGNVTITLYNSSTYTGWGVYCGGYITCNQGLEGGQICLGGSIFAGPSNPTRTMTVYVMAGIPYYLVVNHYGPPHCGTFSDLTISAPVAAPPPSSNPCAPLGAWLLDWWGRVLPSGTHELHWAIAPSIETEARAFYLEAGATPDQLRPLDTLTAQQRAYVRYSPDSKRTFYRLTLELTSGELLSSPALEVATPSATPKLSLQPQPGALKLSLHELISPLHLSLYNSLGQLVAQQSFSPEALQTYTWPLPDLPAGVYTLHWNSGDEGGYQRFLYMP